MNEPRWRRYLRFWNNVEGDVDDEVNFHLQMRIEQFVAAGLSRADAERAAREQFGDLGQVRADLVTLGKHRARRRDWHHALDGVRQDVVVALRGLRRSPVLVAGVVLTLGLGIGANATMFGIIDRLMLRGPAYVVDANRVERLYLTADEGAQGRVTESVMGYVRYAVLRDHAKSLAGVAAYTAAWPQRLGAGTNPHLVPTAKATWDLFPLLGVRPLLGRFYDAAEDAPPHGAHVAVISEGLWRSDFGGNARIVGQRMVLEDETYTIVGVAPAGFTGSEREPVDIWLPMSLSTISSDWPTTYTSIWLSVVARLQPGTTARAAGDEATALLRAAYTGSDADMKHIDASFRPLWYDSSGKPSDVANLARWLMGVAVVVLLITCANVANLLLARTLRRRREVAVRLALGIGRARLIRLLLTETLMLAVGGAVAALVIAAGGAYLMRVTLLSKLEWPGGVLDGQLLAFTLVLALASGVIVGLLPALTAGRTNLSESLKTGEREGGGRRGRVRTVLSMAQTALCVVLLAGAGLFVTSLAHARAVNLGFQPDSVLRANVEFPWHKLTDAERRVENARQMSVLHRTVDQLRAMSWVAGAAIAVGSPYGYAFGVGLHVPGRDSIPELAGGGPWISAVTADYFATVGTPLRRGRLFTSNEGAGTTPVVIVNETMATTLWPNENPLGKCLEIGDRQSDGTLPVCSQVVGVVSDVHRFHLREPASMQYYVPLGQERGFSGPVVLVRSRGAMAAAQVALHQAIRQMPDLPYTDIVTMRSVIDPEFRPWQLGASLFGLFGGLALLVAAVGLYSVIAYLVADRTRELGVRIALGATSGHILRRVVARGVATTAAGIVVGVAVTLVVGRYAAVLLFDVSPYDPVVLGAVAGIVLGIAVVASLAPARRASRIDPMRALASE